MVDLEEGGIILHENNEVFNFSLDKTVYFKRNDAIAEMRKLSLDPDILITPENDYVHINGFIMLQGQYERVTEAQSMEREDFDEEQLNVITNLTKLEDELIKFDYQFPVDITVPAERVADLSNISVAIESFDYDLKNQNELMITSNIEIGGIHLETPEERVDQLETDTSEQEQDVEFDRQISDTERVNELQHMDDEKQDVSEEIDQAQVESEQVETEEKVDLPSLRQEKQEDMAPIIHTDEIEGEVEEKEDANDEVVSERQISAHENEIKQTTIADEQEHETDDLDTLTSEQEQKVDEDLILEVTQDGSGVEEKQTERQMEEFEEENDLDEIDVKSTDQAIDIQVKESEVETEEEVEDLNFLTTIFNRTEEDDYSQLRIYIVQEGDSAHSIAQHYDVSTLKLLQLNQLTDDDIVTGELLYIPARSESEAKN